jgi:hypothetical protein
MMIIISMIFRKGKRKKRRDKAGTEQIEIARNMRALLIHIKK